MREALVQGLAQMGLTPQPQAVDRLCRYGQLLLEQNQVMNLTAITDPVDVARLHFLDSAAILLYGGAVDGRRDGGTDFSPVCGLVRNDPEIFEGRAGLGPAPTKAVHGAGPDGPEIFGGRAGLGPAPAEAGDVGPGGAEALAAGSWLAGRSLVDVGTGAGFPGMVLKILEPSLSLTLVDSLGKRLTWLEKVCEALSLDGVRCFHGRAEELALTPEFRDRFDVATARAVAAYPLLCELCLPYVRPGGVFLAMKSVESGDEVRGGATALKRLGGKALPSWDYPVPGAGVTHRLVGARKCAPTPRGLPRSWGKIKKAPL